MPSDKDRLYVALYARGGAPSMPDSEDRYHWALIVGPKEEKKDQQGMRYHVTQRQVGPGQMDWFYEERDIPLQPTHMLLVRIMIGKVTNKNNLMRAFHNIPIVQGNPEWNCVIWVKHALEALVVENNALGTSQLDWNTVRDMAMKYCQDKKDQHRFDGQAIVDSSKAPTYDLLKGRETTP